MTVANTAISGFNAIHIVTANEKGDTTGTATETGVGTGSVTTSPAAMNTVSNTNMSRNIERRPSSPLLSRRVAPQSLPPTICLQLQYERWQSDYEKKKLQEMCILPNDIYRNRNNNTNTSTTSNSKEMKDSDPIWKSRILELPLSVDYHGGLRCIFLVVSSFHNPIATAQIL